MLYIICLYFLSFADIIICSDLKKNNSFDRIDSSSSLDDCSVENHPELRLLAKNNSTDGWEDFASPNFLKEQENARLLKQRENAYFLKQQENARKNFIEADKIIRKMRRKHAHLEDPDDSDEIMNKDIITNTENFMQKLYRLGELTEQEINDDKEYIESNYKSPYTRRPKTTSNSPFDYLHFSLTRAEMIVAKIFNQARQLGLYLDGYPENIQPKK